MTEAVRIEFDDGSRAVKQQLDLSNTTQAWSRAVDMSIDIFYEIERTAQFICRGQYDRVALQFPDELLGDAPYVLWQLQTQLRKEKVAAEPMLFICGDTSYGACCVDEVAAQHLSAKAIVHYGRACLSPTGAGIPILYVFGRRKLNTEQCATALNAIISSVPSTARIVVLDDVAYGYAMADVMNLLSPAELLRCILGESVVAPKAAELSGVGGEQKGGIRVGGLFVPIESEEVLKSSAVVFIGEGGRQLTSILLRCAGCVSKWRYDPMTNAVTEEGAGTNRDLMRRYHQVQRAKEASVIGIVAAGLSLRGSSHLVAELRKAVEESGRKAYTFAVGRVNVAKLSNFADVQAFCLVSCSEHSLLDAHDFHVPIITPLELEVALGLRPWDGFYSTDLQDATAYMKPDTDVSMLNRYETLDMGEEEDPDAPFFSLSSGKYVQLERVTAPVNKSCSSSCACGEEEGAVSNGVLAEFVSPAAVFLRAREYQGLEITRKGEGIAPHAAVEGGSGIASDYSGV